jgi:DNA-binding transcriptional regulator YdaS (Cro superfamily)
MKNENDLLKNTIEAQIKLITHYLEMSKIWDEEKKELQFEIDRFEGKIETKFMYEAWREEVKGELKQKIKDYFGSGIVLSQRLGVSKAVVSKWINGHESIPLKRAEQIERITHGAITKDELITIQYGETKK